MMKKLRKEQRHKILPAAIALSLGVITPFAPPVYICGGNPKQQCRTIL